MFRILIMQCIILISMLLPVSVFAFTEDLSFTAEEQHFIDLMQGQLDSSLREAFLNPDRIVEVLDLRPTMNVLDIGAGLGFFTFRIADALKRSGMVYATDVEKASIKYVKSKVKKERYLNVRPVLVNRIGLDSFYTRYKFDVIFLSEVYVAFYKPVDYFSALRSSLVPQSGRLFIIYRDTYCAFSDMEFSNMRRIQETFRSKGESFPVFQRLTSDLQQYVLSEDNFTPSSDTKQKLVSAFNMMLDDRRLLVDIADYYYARGEDPRMLTTYAIAKPDQRLFKWLVAELETNGVFDTKDDVSETMQRNLRKLNRILLAGIFSLDDVQTAFYEDVVFPVAKEKVIRDMNEAGYEMVSDHDIVPLHYVLEFKRKY